MGHAPIKDIFYKVGKKIDNHHVRAPWNKEMYAIVKSLFSEEEAEVYVKLPYLFSDFERILKITKYEIPRLQNILEKLCLKGLLIDINVKDKYYYMPSPMVVGVFEFVMMRTGKNLDYKGWAKIFHQYFENGEMYHANFDHGLQLSIARALPHKEAINESQQTQILDYESAEEIVKSEDQFGVGTCSCRHEKMHLGEKDCDHPLNICLTLGWAVDYFVRRKFVKKISKSRVLNILKRSKETGLALCADNVKNKPYFICQCCSCCCNLFMGITRHGCTNTVVTSGYIAAVNREKCNGCGLCVKACPINAIELFPDGDDFTGRKKVAEVDSSFCLGCGVCVLKCNKNSLKLYEREERVLYPETTWERILLQCTGLGTLQNQIFDNPESITQEVMRSIVAAFMKLPRSSKTIMGTALKSRFFRSAFLNISKAGLKLKGKGWIADL